MPGFQVQREIEIEASPEQVFDTVANFNSWQSWSPWLRIDDNAIVDVDQPSGEVGNGYRWDGELVGSGGMTHRRLERPHRIEDDLVFIKPFKSSSKVTFDVDGAGERTHLTWTMEGNLPWFLFWMKSSMVTFVGMDYERGLTMLKEKIETGEVLSKLEVFGVESEPHRSVLGVYDRCHLNDIGPAMESALGKAAERLSLNPQPMDGNEMLSVYHPSCDLKTGQFEFTSGFVAKADPVPSGLQMIDLPAGPYLKIRHTGRYENLGNAWMGAYQYARHSKLKVAKQHSFEVYVNNPQTAEPADLITDVYLPIKS